MKTPTSRTKRLISSILTLAYVSNIFAPLVSHAALPVFETSLITANQYPVAQIEEITLPRDPVAGDVLSITISGSTLTQNFDTSIDLTLQFMNMKIDALPGVSSSVDVSTRTYAIHSQIPGIDPGVGNFIITRAPIAPVTTVNNIVAVAQQSEVAIPQDLFAGDTIAITVAGTGINQVFTGSADTTLAHLAEQITTATNASGSYDSVSRKIHMIAKVAGEAFSLSNLIITSSGMLPHNEVANVVPVAQVQRFAPPRTISSDETLSLTVWDNHLVQAFVDDSRTTLRLLADQINALEITDAFSLGSTIVISAHTPGVPFDIGTLTITGGTIQGATIVPNRVAVAQQDVISVPRDLFPSDRVHLRINNINITQEFSSSTSGTLLALATLINQVPHVYVSNINTITRTLTITSTVPGTPFTTQGLFVETTIDSLNETANVSAKAQRDTITFNRNFRFGDAISLVIDGNTITQAFTGDTNTTLAALTSQMDSMPSIVATADGINREITVTAAIAGVGFSISNIIIQNTVTPTTLVANIVPVKQQNIFSLPQTLLPGDVIQLSIDGNETTQHIHWSEDTALQDINAAINNISSVTSSVDTSSKTFTIASATPGTPFVISSVVSTSEAFTGMTLRPNQLETKASVSLNLNALPVQGESITLGTCVINFVDTGAVDTDCSNNTAQINIAGIVDTETVVAILRGLSGVHDDANGVLIASGTGSHIVSTRSTTQDTLSGITLDIANMHGKIDISTTPSPVIPVAQIDGLTLPRYFAPGDVFTTIIDGITVTQHYTSSANVSFAALVSQINALPALEASASGTTIIITAATAGEPFVLGESQYTNTQQPQLSISNGIAVAQSESIVFPTALVTGDALNLTINGTSVSQNFTTDSTTTLNAFVHKINTDLTGVVTASLSGSLAITLSSAVAGQAFSIDAMDLVHTTTPVINQTNTIAVAQIDTLTLPTLPVSGDKISINVNGSTVSQNFVDDAATTLAILNTKIDTLPSVYSSVDTASGVFTFTAKNPGTPLTISLLSSWAIIDGVTTVENTGAQAQIDVLSVNRSVASSDTLTLTIGDTSVTQTYSTSESNTLDLLTASFNAAQTGVLVTFDAPSKIMSFTAVDPGTPFPHPTLTIDGSVTSVNLVANVYAVAQVDSITLQRNLLAGDTLALTFSGQTIVQAFSGSETDTLAALKATVDAETTTTLSIAWNILTFTAKTAGIPFEIGTFTLTNSVLPTTTVDNVAPVRQETHYTLPTLMQGDIIALSLNGSVIVQAYTGDHTSTMTAIASQANALGSVTATFTGSEIDFIATTAGVPFTLSDATITNFTTPVTIVINIPAVAQEVDFIPNGPVIEGLTYRVTINGENNDYLTSEWDTLAVIVDQLRNTITSTSVIATATGASNEILHVQSAIAGTPFSYSAMILDITAPIVSAPINTAQMLKSGDQTTSTVQSNENSVIYLVASGTIVTTASQLNTAVINGHAFVGVSNAQKNTPYTFTVAHGVGDGAYNIVAIDGYNNVSQVLNGWLTIDNTAPIVTIGTPTQTTTEDQITITGSTNEPNRPFQIISNNWVINGIVSADGAFSGTVTLTPNATNTITISVTDVAGNIGSGSVNITQDSITPPLAIATTDSFTNLSTISVSGSTDPNISVTIYSTTGAIVGSGLSDMSGNFEVPTSLVWNAENILTIIVTDDAQNSNSGIVTITQDSIAPNIILDPVPTLIHASDISISGTTEPFSQVTITNGALPAVIVNASSTGSFSGIVPLTANADNTIAITATDRANNVGSGSIMITEDSTPNALLISTPSQHIRATNIFLSGSTKAYAAIDISGGAVSSSWVADASGNFSLSVELNQNSANTLVVTSTDPVGFVATGSIIITEDSISPTVTVLTPSQTTNDLALSIVGSTEPNSTILITGGSGSFIGLSDNVGQFSVNVSLIPAVQNTLVVTATDEAGNMGSGSVDITHDPVVIFLDLSVLDQATNQDTFTFTGSTKSGATLTIAGGNNTVTALADNAGNFTGTISLNTNTVNNILVTAHDATSTTATGTFTITHDSIAPIITLGSMASITADTAVDFSGMTEASARLSFVNGTGTYQATADINGAFSISIPLIANSINTITGTPTDLAGNTGSGITFDIIQDNLGPIISGLSVTPVVAGNLMNANYIFTTNEIAHSTFFVGTGTNVDASLIATGATSGTSHQSIIAWLQANQTYYYYITTTDTIGNITQTPVAAINSIDTASPVVTAQSVHAILATSARLDFTYTDAHFVSPFATGSIAVTDGSNTLTFAPTLTYSAISMTGSALLSGLTPATTYAYTTTLSDSFRNTTIFTGSFITAALGVLDGGTIIQTGSIQIPTGTGTNQNLSGTTIITNATSGTLTIGTGTTSIDFPSGWDGIILPPFVVPQGTPEAATDNEIQPLVTPLNNASYTFAPNVIETIGVGGFPAPITASGSPFTIRVNLISNQVGQTLNIYHSNDGNTWQNNAPSSSCLVDQNNTCTFQARSLGYFALVRIIQTPRPSSGGGGGGGGSITQDSCPNGDFTMSFYDRLCGTKPTTNTSATGANAVPGLNTNIGLPRVTGNGENIKQDALAYMKRIINIAYPKLKNDTQKLILWKKVINKMDIYLKDEWISEQQKNLCKAIRSLAIELMKRIRINAQLASEAQASDTSTTSDQESENTNLIGLIDLTKSNVISEEREGYTPASILTISGTNIDSLPILPNPDAPIYGGWKYVNAERSLTARMAPNYDSEIYAYLPRNNKIEVTNIGALWSTVSLNEKSVFVRTKYLRDEIEADTMRLDRLLFQNLNQYTDTNIRRVRTHGLNVRKWPNFDEPIIAQIEEDTQVIVLDRVDGWYEIRHPRSMRTGWVRSAFVK